MKIKKIRFPEDGEERMGKIVNRSNSRPTGKYPSWKMNRMMQWQTVAHLNAFRLLDAESSVLSFQEKPMAIEYEDHGVLHTERPDILVVIAGQKELWTIKKLAEVADDHEITNSKNLGLQLRSHGYQQKSVIAEALKQEPRLGNAITLLRLGRKEVSPLAREAFRILVAKRVGGIHWGEFRKGIAGHLGKNILCRLVLEGVIHFDPTMRWTDLTPFNWGCSELGYLGRGS
jgi:hypothetical protein